MRCALVGLIIGAAFGAVQFMMLSKFTRSITGGAFGAGAVILAVSQFLTPIAVLLCFALFFPGVVLWTGAGMAVSLIVCALAGFFRGVRGSDRS